MKLEERTFGTLCKVIKEGLENIAGSGQRSQRKRFVVRRSSGKGSWSWITELGKIKMRDSFEKQYRMIS